MNRKNNWKKVFMSVLAMGLAAGSLASCGDDAKPIGIDTANPTVSVMTMANQTSSAGPDSPVVQEIEKVLGEAMSEKYGKTYDKVTLDIQWTASTAYGEKVTAAMGANEYPHVMLVSTRNSSVIQNSKAGTFWDITDKFKQTDPQYVSEENPEGYVYPKLAQADETINRNISVDGRIYGVYRARELGRQGITFRQDWLDNLGMEQPKTVDDLTEVLRAFTQDDPDGNGVDDTYGMIVTVYLDGPLNNLAVWMGSPNEWGYDEETQTWKPWFMSQGFMDAMDKMHEWYENKYINDNMASLDSNSWDNEFLNGYGGVQIDVADRARRNATNILANNPDAVVDVIGYVTKDENTEPAVWPTTGYNGYYVIPRPAVATEEELDFVLSVLDECNGEEIVDLCNYGILGTHYTIDENGKAVKGTDAALNAQYNDLNQFSMGLAPTTLSTAYVNKTAEKVEQVYKENRDHAVVNPMAPYTSDTYSISGTQLDAIIAEAKTNYIVGNIDRDGWAEAIEQWLKMDGDLVMEDYANAYNDDESNHDENGNVIIPDEYKYDFAF